MATPIKETPILTGEDARRFLKRMEETREISEEDIQRVKRNYELIMSIATFDQDMDIEEVGKWQIRPLGERETISAFTCGDSDIDDYITNESVLYQKEMLSVNYILESDTECMVAFFSLHNDRVCVTDFDNSTEFNKFRKKRFVQAKRHKGYPAVKIGRLGVATEMRLHGLGSILLDFIKAYFVNHQRTGCRFLTVDAYLKSVEFYEKNGFTRMNNDTSGKTCLMYFDLKDFNGKL